jgi:hypothetical protein
MSQLEAAGAWWRRPISPTWSYASYVAAWTSKATGMPSSRLGRPSSTHTDYRVIEVDLAVGSVHRTLHTPQEGDHNTNWKGAAARIVNQAAAWVNANRDAILAQRHEAP